jgi:hypothetical protein
MRSKVPDSIILLHYITQILHSKLGDRGSRVVKVLCYKSEGRWFNPS